MAGQKGVGNGKNKNIDRPIFIPSICCKSVSVSALFVMLTVTSTLLRPTTEPKERKIPGSNPVCDGIFPGSSHTRDLKIGTQVATLPGTWRYRVSVGTGWPGVSIL